MLLDTSRSLFPRDGRLILAGSLAFSGVVGYLFASWVIQRSAIQIPPAQEESSQVKTLLVLSDANLDLGTITEGGHKEVTLWLKNACSEAVELGKITTSCDCFHVSVERMVVPADEKVKVVATVDFRDEPNYRGRLALEAEGVAKEKNQLAFLIKASVTVGR